MPLFSTTRYMYNCPLYVGPVQPLPSARKISLEVKTTFVTHYANFITIINDFKGVRAGVLLQISNREKFWPFSVILKRSVSLLEYSFYIFYVKPLLRVGKREKWDSHGRSLLPRLPPGWRLWEWKRSNCIIISKEALRPFSISPFDLIWMKTDFIRNVQI